ncbi:hypothetical protein ES707_16524 [subsurface metagenome]
MDNFITLADDISLYLERDKLMTSSRLQMISLLHYFNEKTVLHYPANQRGSVAVISVVWRMFRLVSGDLIRVFVYNRGRFRPALYANCEVL